jgi:hypothetical protein
MGKVRRRVDFLSLAWGLALDSVSTLESELAFELALGSELAFGLALESEMAFELVLALESVLALGSVSTLVSALESMLALGKASRSEEGSSRALR